MKTYKIPVVKLVNAFVWIEANNIGEAIELVNAKPGIGYVRSFSDADIEIIEDEIGW